MRNLLVLIVFALLSGCSGAWPNTFKGYSGPDLPDAELAVIHQRCYVCIRKIQQIDEDGNYTLVYQISNWGGVTPIKVLPGKYHIHAHESIRNTMNKAISPTLVLQEGHAYTFHGETCDILDWLLFHAHDMTSKIYITDDNTGEIIAGTKC